MQTFQNTSSFLSPHYSDRLCFWLMCFSSSRLLESSFCYHDNVLMLPIISPILSAAYWHICESLTWPNPFSSISKLWALCIKIELFRCDGRSQLRKNCRSGQMPVWPEEQTAEEVEEKVTKVQKYDSKQNMM